MQSIVFLRRRPFLSIRLSFCGHVHFLPFPPERDYASLNITTCSEDKAGPWSVDGDFGSVG